MESTSATLKSVRISAQKARLVADMIRGDDAEKAIDKLEYLNKKAAKLIKKLLDSAVANAETNHSLDSSDLFISAIRVDKGPSFKRMRPRARGRGNTIEKQTCHIYLELTENIEG